MPTWKGANETLELRVNDKLEQLYFQCTPIDMQKKIRQHGIDFKDEQRPVDMLIGLDNINKLQLSEERRLTDDVIAKRTTIGWVIFGVQPENNVSVNNDPVPVATVLDVNVEKEGEVVDKALKGYCDRDHIKPRYGAKSTFIPSDLTKSNLESVKVRMERLTTTKQQIGHRESMNNQFDDNAGEQVHSNEGHHSHQSVADEVRIQNRERTTIVPTRSRKWRSSDEMSMDNRNHLSRKNNMLAIELNPEDQRQQRIGVARYVMDEQDSNSIYGKLISKQKIGNEELPASFIGTRTNWVDL
ncbi:hypothetical protein BLA29_008189, partial [Euroglyphus maynei]